MPFEADKDLAVRSGRDRFAHRALVEPHCKYRSSGPPRMAAIGADGASRGEGADYRVAIGGEPGILQESQSLLKVVGVVADPFEEPFVGCVIGVSTGNLSTAVVNVGAHG